ncbi:hypothetical protein C8R44DRAFT_695998 [Mycena epipterygia]|nr:hypothetical protein C8R44DRAFT_695998 [Mycena epipterygia]
MTQTDLKQDTRPDDTLHIISGPPPYVPVLGNGMNGLAPCPRNNIVISRTFGALKRTRFSVDPNIHLPASLIQSSRLSVLPRRTPNLELSVDFGAIDVDVEVLPLQVPAEAPPENWVALNEYGSTYLNERRSSRKDDVHLEAGTTTGNIDLRVHAPHTTPISVRVSSTFGQVRVYIPRTFHGPLTISSSLLAPRLSPELRRVCTPLSEVGDKVRWFVGDVGAWTAKGERGDEVRVGSEFGRVWVGFVGEDADAARALGRAPLEWGLNAVKVILMLCAVALCWRLLEAS